MPIWEIKPKRLEFKGKADGTGFEESEKIVFISNLGKNPINIQEVSCKNENLKIEVPDEKEIKPGEKIKLTATINPEFAPEYNISASIAILAKIGEETTNSSVRVLIRPPAKESQY